MTNWKEKRLVKTVFAKYRFVLLAALMLSAAAGTPACAQQTQPPAAAEDVTSLYPAHVHEFAVKDASLKTAIDTLMRKSGLKIVIDPGIERSITLYLNDIAPKDILHILADANDLAYAEDNGIIRIMTPEKFTEEFGHPFGEKIKTKMVPLLHAKLSDVMDVLEQMKSKNGKVIFNDDTSTFILIDEPEKLNNMITYIKKVDIPIETTTFTPKYITAATLAEQIKPLLTLNIGKLSTEDHTVTVTDTLLKLNDYKELVAKLDQPEKDVRIKAKIIQIVLNDEHQKGVDWGAIVSGFQQTSFLGMKNAIEGKNRKISWGTVSKDDYKVLLEALDTVGDISEVDNVELTSPLRKKEELDVQPFEVISLVPEEKAYVDRNGNKEEFKLYLTPKSYKDNVIDMSVVPEVFSLEEQPADVPVEDGSTIVIGGLFKTVTVETERKIPLLSDIPLIRDVPFEDIPILGFPFRNAKRHERMTEIIIFLSAETVASQN